MSVVDAAVGDVKESNTDDKNEAHCDTCINIDACLKNKSNSCGIQSVGRRKCPNSGHSIMCPIVYCQYKCQVHFHSCKEAEHVLLCLKKTVPCINVGYGCPFQMQRIKLSSHLATCPASVVVCTVEWNRKLLREGATQPFRSNVYPVDLDVAALNRDKDTLRDFKTSLPISLQNVLKSHTNKYPIMPLAVAGNRIPNCILQRHAATERDSKSQDKSLVVDDEDTSSNECSVEIPSTLNPPGLQQSICAQLGIKPLDSSSQPITEQNSLKEEPTEVRKKSTRELSLLIDVIGKHSGRFLDWHTFMCGREFRRDEYSRHFQNVHTEILTQLNGWLVKRCPMATYGCPFAIQRKFPRMEPTNQNYPYEVVYNEDLESFCVAQKQTTNKTDNSFIVEEIGTGFCDLPIEILLRLTKYLDSLSLNALSRTNKKLREICACVLFSRGIVVLDWEKDIITGKWETVGRKWLFSTSFSSIPDWTFGEPGLISNHMKTCSYYISQKNRPQEPFCYPVKESDL